MADDVLYDKQSSGVALITLNRPESLNAMGGRLMPMLARVTGRSVSDCRFAKLEEDRVTANRVGDANVMPPLGVVLLGVETSSSNTRSESKGVTPLLRELEFPENAYVVALGLLDESDGTSGVFACFTDSEEV